MKKEIEKKYKIGTHDLLKNKLKEMSFNYENEGMERDIYFNVSGRDSLRTKECLRIRDYGHRQEITYKGESVIELGHFSKEEVNLEIKDVNGAAKLLSLVGNSPLVDFTKNRITFSRGDISVLLDTLFYQSFKINFLEIEIISDNEKEAIQKINEIASSLGLDDSMIELRPYRDIAMGL